MRFLFALVVALLFCRPILAAEPPTEPILRIETGMHTSTITSIATDAAGHWLVTASLDKTLRVWDLSTDRLVRTIRPPIGVGNEGKLFSVALSPDGATIVCAGWTGSWDKEGHIYIYNRVSGNLTGRITGLPNVISHLAFSPDGHQLAVTLFSGGIRLYRTNDWSQSGADRDYVGASYSAHFSQEDRLVTTCVDGSIRLYETRGEALRLIKKVRAFGGTKPSIARFSPDGSKIAVGHSDTSNVSVVSGQDLVLLYSPDTNGTKGGNLGSVAWSADGRTLFASGSAKSTVSSPIRRWIDAGRGSYSDTSAANNTITDLASFADGRLAFGSSEPAFGLLDQAGKRTLFVSPAKADYRDSEKMFSLSSDSATVGFGYEPFGKFPALFDLNRRSIIQEPSKLLHTALTNFPGLEVTGWKDTKVPKLNGAPLVLAKNDTSYSLAIDTSGTSLVLGAEWSLYRFNSQGIKIWEIPVPGTVWAVNISGKNSLILAAYGDGTIRWHRMSDGKELLAFFPHADKKRWVLWTPEGFFDHSPGGEELIGYHLNRGKDKAAEFIPVSKLYNSFYRPDLVDAAFAGKDLSEFAKAIDVNKLLTVKTLPPKVRILTKAGSTTQPEIEISTEVCDNGGGVGDITLYLNDMPVTVGSAGRGINLKLAGGACSTFTRPISLDNGDNRISIMAYNKDNTIESDRDSVVIKHTSSFTGKPNLHILTVSVDRYRDGDLQLKFSNADAKAVAERISGKGKDLFGTVNSYNLSDAEVTKENLDKAFTDIGKKIRREDMFIFFVAGHGITYSKDGSFYYLPVNFRYSQDEDIPKLGISMNDFKRYLANIQATKSLLLLDTCNSGSFVEAIASRGVIEKTAINKLTRAVGRHTLVASSKGQIALEGYEGHGAFSWVLLDGFSGKAANAKGQITVNSLVSFVESTLPDLTYKKWGYEQIPQKMLQGEDFQISVK